MGRRQATPSAAELTSIAELRAALRRFHAATDAITERHGLTARRYELMKGAKDPRAELKREMRRIQGALAVDLRLHMGGASDDDADVARHIDRFCLTTADATSLSWQACASSLVWFLRAEGTR